MVHKSLEVYHPILNAWPLSLFIFFADDCLLLAKASISNALMLRKILEEYLMHLVRR